MAYITKNNESQIVSAITKLDIFKALDLNIYQYPISMLSNAEKKRLAKIKEFFQNFELYLEEIFHCKIAIDTKTFVNEGKPPAYHYYQDCQGMHSDYLDYYLPVEIKAKGDSEIQRYRDWFTENKYILNSDPTLFSTRLQLKFPFIKNTKAIESILKRNSGYAELDDINLSQLEAKIDNIIRISESYKQSSEEIRNVINKYGHSTQERDKIQDPTIKVILDQWHSYKLDLKKLLETFYKVKFNPDLQFEGTLLKVLGFKECDFCAERKIAESVDRFGF